MSGYPATQPTFAGFVNFVRMGMGIGTDNLPDDSIWLVYAYNVAIAVVNLGLAAVGGPIYMLSVYNLAADNLINYAQDTPPSTYFADLRKFYKIGSLVPGLIQSTSDQGTSESLMIPDALKDLTLANLQNLKTPWGRQYLAWAQSWGTVWGLS
jgi:hypothetical protein